MTTKYQVCLINPPQTELREPTAYLPLGIAYLAATLLNSGVETRILNLADKETLEDVNIPESEWYGITCVSATYNSTVELCKTLDGKIVIGGVHPTIEPKQTLEDTGADFVITGEGDYVFRDLVLGNLKSKNRIVEGGIIKDLDLLPLPARHLFPRDEVVNTEGILGCERGVVASSIITARGCPYSCRFCVKNHEMFRKFRYRSAENIREELALLIRDYGVQHVRILDDTFTLIRKRVLDLCDGIKDLGITWACITRCDHIDEEMLRSMKESGCIEINIGVETGSKRLLKLMNKGETVETYLKASEKIKRVGILLKTFLMYDFPTETQEDREETIQLIKKIKPEKFSLSKFTLLPGSYMWLHPEEYGISKTRQRYFYPDEDDAGWMEFKRGISSVVEGNGGEQTE